MIAKLLYFSLPKPKKVIKLISSDADVFVLLCTSFQKYKWMPSSILMEMFTESKTVIDINKSVELHHPIVPSLIAMHALTGCDSVPMLYGIGKNKGLQIIKSMELKHLGNIDSMMGDVLEEGRQFIAKCYNMKRQNSSKNRYSITLFNH